MTVLIIYNRKSKNVSIIRKNKLKPSPTSGFVLIFNPIIVKTK